MCNFLLKLATNSTIENYMTFAFKIGFGIGHLYYFLQWVFPNQRGGWRILKTPKCIKELFDEEVPIMI